MPTYRSSVRSLTRALKFARAGYTAVASSSRSYPKVEFALWGIRTFLFIASSRVRPKNWLSPRSSIWQSRMRVCHRCPVFSQKWLTCGSLEGPKIPGTSKPMGCLCFMPVKSRITDAKCWLSERTDGKFGWFV